MKGGDREGKIGEIIEVKKGGWYQVEGESFSGTLRAKDMELVNEDGGNK